METKIINMTPHPVDVIGDDNKIIQTIETSGKLIRLQAATVPAGDVAGIPVTKTEFGTPEGLPEYQENVFYIVSQLVKSAVGRNRTDLLVPAEVVRDETGRIIGCRSLGV